MGDITGAVALNQMQLDEYDFQKLIIKWLLEDEQRCHALLAAQQMQLNDWMLAAGFVRNLVWDKLHGLQTPLNDIDLIYFDLSDLSIERDKAIEAQLKRIAPMFPWSVKNQARMHLRNEHQPYRSSLDAMSYWPEKQTAVAVSSQFSRLSASGFGSGSESESVSSPELILHSNFGLSCLFDFSLQQNPKACRSLFKQRVKNKRWLQTYPKLRDNDNW
ncbi:nucleotidyltransferase family protein [Shewanella pneumatophori]|uniref:Nucleotidyltransferase family protein n=1 Tax=Shewanella pneumatophori TaxID=314092 RepID=A0A9X1ZGJ8_9GAMM|nr:nucleotidyltransferase family protein [Shewanella pneumatophori]MCL1139030.1 nucleotidyltransferase family protein [Shewanella pneumatophori]